MFGCVGVLWGDREEGEIRVGWDIGMSSFYGSRGFVSFGESRSGSYRVLIVWCRLVDRKGSFGWGRFRIIWYGFGV